MRRNGAYLCVDKPNNPCQVLELQPAIVHLVRLISAESKLEEPDVILRLAFERCASTN